MRYRSMANSDWSMPIERKTMRKFVFCTFVYYSVARVNRKILKCIILHTNLLLSHYKCDPTYLFKP